MPSRAAAGWRAMTGLAVMPVAGAMPAGDEHGRLRLSFEDMHLVVVSASALSHGHRLFDSRR